MPFHVCSDDPTRPGENLRVQQETRKDAFAMAVDLLRQGKKVVTIIDEVGRVYRPGEFAAFLADWPPKKKGGG
jgi:hypothetical protein